MFTGAETAASCAAQSAKLPDRLRKALRTRHSSRRTEQASVAGVKRFICFHSVRHPAEMAEPEINAFLTHPAVNETCRCLMQKPDILLLRFVL